MDKAEIIKEIDAKKLVARNLIAVTFIFASRAWVDTFRNFVTPGKITFNNEVIEFANPSSFVDKFDAATIEETSVNIIRLSLRDMVNQTFELIQSYSKLTNQKQAFNNSSWYHFARIIRNSFSHNFILNLSRNDGSFWPDQQLQFSGKIIELKQSMHGQPVTFEIISITHCFELVEMMKQTLINDLN